MKLGPRLSIQPASRKSSKICFCVWSARSPCCWKASWTNCAHSRKCPYGVGIKCGVIKEVYNPYIIHISSIYNPYIRNIHRYLWYKIIRNTDPMGRPPKAAPVFLIILYHKYLWIFHTYIYIYIYSLYSVYVP